MYRQEEFQFSRPACEPDVPASSPIHDVRRAGLVGLPEFAKLAGYPYSTIYIRIRRGQFKPDIPGKHPKFYGHSIPESIERLNRYFKKQKGRTLEERKKRRREHRIRRWHLVGKFRAKNDPQFRIKRAIAARIREALKRSFKGAKKSGRTMALVGCSSAELVKHLESQFKPGMSWANYGVWQMDHIRPCASFDLTQPSEQEKCFHYTNVQPMWAFDNIIKSDKWKDVDT